MRERERERIIIIIIKALLAVLPEDDDVVKKEESEEEVSEHMHACMHIIISISPQNTRITVTPRMSKI